MEYSVKMTPHAVLQIEEIISYISHVLMSPESAKGWTDRLQKEIAGLSELPERFPLLDAEPWHSRGIRKMPVKNFLVSYWIDTETHTVWLVATLYGKRDQISALKQMPFIGK